eukprot:767013-Hanusia_phi.AAC.2
MSSIGFTADHEVEARNESKPESGKLVTVQAKIQGSVQTRWSKDEHERFLEGVARYCPYADLSRGGDEGGHSFFHFPPPPSVCLPSSSRSLPFLHSSPLKVQCLLKYKSSDLSTRLSSQMPRKQPSSPHLCKRESVRRERSRSREKGWQERWRGGEGKERKQ